MVHPLIGLHATLGELGVFAFLWMFVELLNPDEQRLRRAKIASFFGVIFLVASWLTGGYYYVVHYGEHIKPVIKEGPAPWAHGIVMEAKEHIFLFLPFLAIVIYAIVHSIGGLLIKDRALRKSVLTLVALTVLIGLGMALMGYTVSTGFRVALEAMHIG